jgi:ATP-binding cassette, subfamily B, bacterial
MFMPGGHWGSMARSSDEKPKLTRSLMRRVLKYAWPYRWRLGALLLTITINTALSLVSPLILRDLIDQTIPSGDTVRLVWLSLALLGIPILSGGVTIVQRWMNAGVGEGVIFDLRTALYSRLERMSLHFFTHTRVGEMMSRLNNDVVGAQNAISSTIVGMITNVIQAVALLAVMSALEWRLTLASVIILPLFILAALRLGGRMRDIARSQMEANARMNAMANETLNIGGALLVKLFGRTRLEGDRFNERAGVVRDLGIKRAVTGNVFFVIVSLVSAIGTALVYGLGGHFAMNGDFTVGKIVAFGSYLTHLYGVLQGLASAPVEFAASVVSFERVFEVLDLPLDIEDKPDAQPLEKVNGELVFDQVTFTYEDNGGSQLKKVKRYGSMDSVDVVLSEKREPAAEEPEETQLHSQARDAALEKISFRAEPGRLTALAGPSGAGKTTLTYLIPRLYDPNAGRILLDGIDLRDLTLETLSSSIGMVTQEVYLFHDSIRTNLSYAKLDATQHELEESCRAANLHNFIRDLPEGYDTIVGERGYRLSGGEKQRLALARVILKNPRILVLDEATSHLDSESEALIQEALKRVMAGRTSIVIAHRLSTILAADQILVMDRGEIVERGTHHQLLEKGGVYAGLYQTQFGSN